MSKKPTILIIEDNPVSRKMFRVTLQLEDYQVYEAKSGKEALKLASTHKFELILQDLILADMGGSELTRQLRTMPLNADTPIIALSGFLSYAETSSLDFTSVLLKPIEPSHLLNVIKTYLPPVLEKKFINKARRVLIADDNPTQRKLLKLQLIHAGFEVVTAEDGKDALEQITANPPHAVISDVLMPHMDGFELCLAIRRNPKLKDIPVILLTSQYLEQADQELGKEVGANFYLNRSVDAMKLIAILNQSLESKPKSLTPESIRLFKKEHTHRLIRQLELQVNNNIGLAQRCALQTAQLSLLGGVAEALTSSRSIKDTLKRVLAACLDAAGISRGLLYIFENRKLTLAQVIGYSEEEMDKVAIYFSTFNLLDSICSKKAILQIKKDSATKIENELLDRAKISSALFIPLISRAECYGVLFLGSRATNVTGVDPINFANTLGIQLGQSIALAAMFERLTDSENRYRTLVANASSGIFVCDEGGYIIEINEQVKKILQRNTQDIVGKNVVHFVAPREQSIAYSLFDQLVQKGILEPREIRILRKDQSLVLIEVSAARVKTQNETLLLGLMNDVTEKNQLRMRAMLQDRLAMAGTLATSVAHEINNPISWILGNLNYLKKNIVALQKKDQQEWPNLLQNLEDIVKESIQGAERICDIVHMFKSFGRTATEEDSTYIDVHEVLESAIRMAALEFKHRASIKRQFSAMLPKIFANSGRLHQVFLNLLINAAQAIPEGRRKKDHITITTRWDNTSICVDIEDTGIGIDSVTLTKIFDPFFTTKESGVGTGLGLAISHEIISKFGGSLTVKSELEKGSIFTVSLPINYKEIASQ